MNLSVHSEPIPNFASRSSPYPTKHSPYPYHHSKMNQRRAIACTICAKAKTKCDKAVPTCSRCEAKGLPCEPRSTRRTSDSSYRQVKKRIVSPKRFHSTSSMPTMAGMRRDEGPRSVPFPRHPLARTMSQVDMSGAMKMPGRQPELTGMPMLTPLQTFNPNLVTDVYADFGSPDHGLSVFSNQPAKTGYFDSGRLTPQTPDSFTYSEPLSIMDTFDPYTTSHNWSEESHVPIGLGFEGEIPGMLQNEPVWTTPDLDGESTPVQQMRTFESPVCESPASFSAWPHSSLSVSPQPPHTRAVPSLSMSECSVGDFDSPTPVQEEWPCFRCNPNEMSMSKGSASSTYLEGLKSISKDSNTWDDLIAPRHRSNSDPALNKYLTIPRFAEFSRGTVMDVVNNFVRRAREIADRSGHSPSPMLSTNEFSAEFDDETPLTTPAPHALESLFRLYGSRFEAYYPSFAGRKLDFTELLQTDASKLYLLLIVAAGASATPTMDASLLTNGLMEASRILLDDLTDNDLSLWKDPMVLRTALLSINLAAWSGEKWHMDVAKTQSAVYFEFLQRSGLFAYREKYLPEFDGLVGTEISWKKWKQHEGLNRLVHSWIIVDQELALFHDKAPNFNTNELTAALPDQEALWQASSADSWANVYNRTNAANSETPPSLNDLFKRLMSRELVNDPRGVTKLQLRLLLHPIQALVHHLHQCIGCFAGEPSSPQAPSFVKQMLEVQAILGDWYNLYCRCVQKEGQACPVLLTNLMMYSLICLNTMTYFPDIESFARGELGQEQFVATGWARTEQLGSARRIWFHCGQVMRLVRSIPEVHRPIWMPAAVYRVCLLLWSTSMANNNPLQPAGPFNNSVFPIDDMLPENDAVQRFLLMQQGTPILSLKKGVFYSITSPAETIAYCLEVMKEEEFNTNFAMGIRNRLEILSHRVKVISPIL